MKESKAVVEETERGAARGGLLEQLARFPRVLRQPTGALVVKDAELRQPNRRAHRRRRLDEAQAHPLALLGADPAPHAATKRSKRVHVALGHSCRVPLRAEPRVTRCSANATKEQQAERLHGLRVAGIRQRLGDGKPLVVRDRVSKE